MQVKKYEASSVIEALKEVKSDLGPDAIILSTQEAKRSRVGAKRFIVVAAVSESQLKKKEMAEKHMETVYRDRIQEQSALKQKMFIENVYRGIEKKHEARNKTITATPYIDISDDPDERARQVANAAPTAKTESPLSLARVKQAAQEAFKSSLTSDFFTKQNPQKEEALLEDEVLRTIVRSSVKPQKPQVLSEMSERLKASGVSQRIRERWIDLCAENLGQSVERKALVDAWFAKKILSQVKVVESSSQPIEIFVGPHGAGKTTSLVKLATHYVVQENKRVAVITTDLNKVGGVEQLRVYSRILNAPIFVVQTAQDLQQKVSELVSFDKILIDTQGISLSNIEELDFMRNIAHLKTQRGHRVHLVISALTKENDLGGLLKRFRVANFDDIIVTNIDQTSQHGILLNIQEKMSQPFHSFGIGSDIVDGFEKASRERVLDLIFKLTKRSGERGNDSRI